MHLKHFKYYFGSREDADENEYAFIYAHER